MGTNKRIGIVLLISLCFLPLFQLAYAQKIHKWVDEKGVVHFEDDSGTIIMSAEPQTAATQKGDELARQRMFKESAAPSPNLNQALPQRSYEAAKPNLSQVLPQSYLRSYYDAHPGEYEFELAQKEYLKIKAAELKQRQLQEQEARRAQAELKKKLEAIKRAQDMSTRMNRGAIDTTTGEYYPGVANGIINPRTGEFMPAVAGGYIDPTTGRFIPKQ